MDIALADIGKKYRNEWVFKNVTHQFSSGEKWLIQGSNGSGKSTFIKVLSGFTAATKGSLNYKNKKYKNIHLNFSVAAPYLELIESMTLFELYLFQAQFKPFYTKVDNEHQLIELFDLSSSTEGKRVGEYSSGMKQRVKLGLAILSDTPVLILDEPVSNLDKKGIEWYNLMIKNYSDDRLVLVCSNAIEDEYRFCDQSFCVEDYKN